MDASTPKKTRIIAICDYLAQEGHTGFHSKVFRRCGVSTRTGWRLLKQAREDPGLEPRTFHSNFRETRGRPKKISDDDLAKLEALIASEGQDARVLQWKDLPAAAGLDLNVSSETVRRRMREISFRRCLACQKSYVPPNLAARRLEYATTMLQRYPRPEDWHHVRFSDEVHFGFGPEGKTYIIRRPWERSCPECVVEKREPPAKDIKRVHAWAAVGYEFKSPLVWYEVPGNTNGKMSLRVYRDQILKPVVGQWLRDGHSFVLEEDNDSGHGTGQANIVRTWKKQHGLDYFFNCSQSPDIPPIEKAWQAPKEAVRTCDVWSDEWLKELAEEGWAGLTQEKINSWVDQIPQILQDIVINEGRMSGY